MKNRKIKNIENINFVLISLLGVSSILFNILSISQWIITIIIAALFVLTILTKIYEQKIRSQVVIDSDVEKMELLLKNLYNSLGFKEEEYISITIHKKIDDKHYQRFTRTIKHNILKDDKGQKFEIKKGIVRLAFERKDGDVFHDTFKDDDDKYLKLTYSYHYDNSEALKMLEDNRKSYYCRTIVQDELIWGTLYMTSAKYKGFLNTKNVLRKDLDKKIEQTIEFIQNEIL